VKGEMLIGTLTDRLVGTLTDRLVLDRMAYCTTVYNLYI